MKPLGASAASLSAQRKLAFKALRRGGNDALLHVEMLDAAFETVSRDVLVKLWGLRESFRSDYCALLDALVATGRPVLAMTVYNPCFLGYGMAAEDQRAAESALSIINDVIQQEARARSFDVLEIRAIFTGEADYANPIEPSATGGAKLAAAISVWLEDRLKLLHPMNE